VAYQDNKKRATKSISSSPRAARLLLRLRLLLQQVAEMHLGVRARAMHLLHADDEDEEDEKTWSGRRTGFLQHIAHTVRASRVLVAVGRRELAAARGITCTRTRRNRLWLYNNERTRRARPSRAR
jgi:hypothetical protein